MRNQSELWMTQKDRDRLKVLHEADKGHLTQKQAGVQLKLSERWVRELLARLREEGDGGILHRLRGRAAKRRLAAAGGGGARLASPTGLLGRTGAVGHLRPRLAGGAGAEAVFAGHGR